MDPELLAPADSTPARDGIAERLAEMIRLPTVSATRQESGLAVFAAFDELLARLYPLVHARLSKEKIGDLSLVFRWAPVAPHRAQPVVLMAHYDVVPAGAEDGWRVPPFEGRRIADHVWGRGALDDKGALCGLLEAVENLLAEGWTPRREVVLCLGGDEEDRGDAARQMAATLRERGVRPWFVLDEGGAVTDLPLPGVSGRFAMIGLAEKGVMVVRLTATADAGHASAPSGMTAVGRIARAAARLNRNPFRPRTPATVRLLLASLADHASPRWARIYRAAAALPAVTARVLPLLGAEAAALARTSLAATMLAGGTGANVLPASASATLNLRVNVGESTAGVLARLRRVIADPKVTLDILESDEPTGEATVGGPAWALLESAVAAAFGSVPVVPYLTTAATDGRHWHRFVPDVYRFAPQLMDADQRASVHGVDEHVSVDSLRRSERFYRALLKGIPA